MTSAKEKVLELVSSGKISAAEGDALLKAMQRSKRSLVKLLINPMESMGLGWLLLLSVVGAGCSLWLSTWNVRFDGALDVHLASHSVSLRQAVLDQVFDWPLTTFVLWIVAVVVARQGRLIDFLASFCAALIFAEVASKLALYWIHL